MLKKNILSILLISLVAIVTSCEKVGNTITGKPNNPKLKKCRISGRVCNAVNMEPIGGVQIDLYRKLPTDYGYTEFSSTITDNSGYYTFDKIERNYLYQTGVKYSWFFGEDYATYGSVNYQFAISLYSPRYHIEDHLITLTSNNHTQDFLLTPTFDDIEISPNVIDLNRNQMQASFVIQNNRSEQFQCSISGFDSRYLRISPTTFLLRPNGTTTITVGLTNSGASISMRTDIAVHIGDDSYSVTVSVN